MKRKKIIRLLLSSLVLVGQPLVETEQVTTEELVSNPAELLGKDLFQPRATIEEIWPGQSMMLEEYHLNDDDWQSIKIVNSADSLTTFPINVEGYDEGVLVGHIRFGGVNRQTGKFEIDKAKQLRNLVFIVENTQKFKDKEKKVTVKYTYNYYQGTNSTYTMVPITAMKQAGQLTKYLMILIMLLKCLKEDKLYHIGQLKNYIFKKYQEQRLLQSKHEQIKIRGLVMLIFIFNKSKH